MFVIPKMGGGEGDNCYVRAGVMDTPKFEA